MLRRWFWVLIIVAVALSLVAGCHSTQSHTPVALCPHGQHANLVGFGKATDGSYLATYDCESDSKAVAKK